MNEQRVAEAWSLLDREYLASVVRNGPEPLFATISGAHLYGFASPNSDVDLRGAFVLPTKALLGLDEPNETLSVADASAGLELDWVAHEVRKFVRMMTQDNGYVLEQLYSPLVIVGNEEHEELKELGRCCVTRGLFRHYRGFARGRRKLLAEPNPTVKHLLYAYRVYLTGIRALRTGTIEANVIELNEEFRFAQITELVERKREGAEKMLLDPAEIPAQLEVLDGLETALDAAHASSALPEHVTNRAALDDFVVRVRMARMGG
jgi:uncharacterized protein